MICATEKEKWIVMNNNKKYYCNHYDGADYYVATYPDHGGAPDGPHTFRKAKSLAIAKALDDISQLKMIVKELRKLRKKDIKCE